MRTLEDWFKYLEQQYVDERAQKEAKSSEEQPEQKQEPARPEPVTSRVETPPAQEAKREETPKARPAPPPRPLQQVQVEEVSVPDPADYIFTLRRAASEPAASSAEPAVAEEEVRSETTEPAEPPVIQPVVQPTAPAAGDDGNALRNLEATPPAPQITAPAMQEPEEPPVEERGEQVAEPTAEEAKPETVDRRAEPIQRAKPLKRAPYTRSVRPVPPPQSIEELWKRVPKHVRLLVELGDDEVTQRYYDRQFKESRQELVERLLNPSLTLEDTARLLGVCPTTVRRYTERGLLNHYRTPGNQRRFRLSDVIAFLEARQQAQEARRRKR